MNTKTAVVTKVMTQKGYVVTMLKDSEPRGQIPEGDSITFNLNTWKGTSTPRRGQMVMLSDISQFQSGWRAESASPVTA